MPSTPTTRLKIEKQALGENSATWGAPKLNDAFDRIDEAIAGVEAISTSGGTTTLTSTNYATDQARKAVLVISGTLASAATIVVPALEKVYLCINNCTLGSYSVTIKTALGAGVVLPAGPYMVYCNGTSVFSGSPRLDGLGTAAGILNMGGYRVTNSATPTATTDLATKAYVDAAVVAGDNTAALATLQASIDSSLATLAPKAAPTFTGGMTLSTGVFTVPLGSASVPSYSFSGDSNTGIFSSGADSVSLVAGGTARATASSSGLGVTGALTTTGAASIGSTLGVTGAATFGSTVGITGALTSGAITSSGGLSGTTLSASGAATLSSTLAVTSNATIGGTLGVTGAVTASSTVTAGGVVLGPAGSVSAPTHSFSTDTNSGMYSGGADIVRLATGGVDRLSIDASGDVGIGRVPYANSGWKTLAIQGTNGGVLELMSSAGTLFGRIFSDIPTTNVTVENRHATGALCLGAGTGVERMRVRYDGCIQIGQSTSTTPGYSTEGSVVGIAFNLFGTSGRVFISQDAFSQWNMTTTGNVLVFAQSGTTVGGISITGSTTSFNTSSDYRLKEDVEPLTGALARVAKLKPSRFRFKAEKKSAKKIDGFLAHEVAQVVPEAVTGEKDGDEMQGLDLSKLVPVTIAALQELAARVEALEKAKAK